MPLTAEAKTQVKSALDACTDPASGTGIPGLVFCAIDKSGNYLTRQASGNIGQDTKTPMDLDSVFWIASCTKLITAIACMQLVEQGKLDLDSSKQLYEICPELKDIKVLNDKWELEKKEKEITIRMLLTHTAGFGYNFFNTKLRDHKGGYNVITCETKTYTEQPLVNQPGSRFEYGMNIDWVGIAVERVSGMTLDEYFNKNIFKPLGMKHISFFPSEHMRQHLVKSHQRDDEGVHELKDPIYLAPIAAGSSESEKAKVFQAGGAGCFATPSEYCLMLAALLNGGTSPNTGAKILDQSTVDEMFKNQIPQFPNFGREPIESVLPTVSNSLPEIYPQEGNPPQGWGLTFFITIEPGATGRGPNTGQWAGLVNLFYWVDRAKGVAGMIASQLLPFGDPHVLGTWVACEKAIYDGLT